MDAIMDIANVESRVKNGGNFKAVLDDLVNCDFVRRYRARKKKNRESFFQLIDNFTLFHYEFLTDGGTETGDFWTKQTETPKLCGWRGRAFERVCLLHVDQIKRALSIGGVQSSESAWYSTREKRDDRRSAGAQIDLLIDRNDDVIDVCEMKYYQDEVVLDEEEVGKIENRMLRLREETGTEKAIHAILVTTKGLKRNAYSDVVQDVVTMSDLFGDF